MVGVDAAGVYPSSRVPVPGTSEAEHSSYGVYSEPRDLDRAVLADALVRCWSIGAARLD
jgi:hypothetical protein